MRYNESCTNGALHMMDETEQKIMNAAASLFAEKGLRFTMQELASSLHMSKKSIYKLYDNKEDLMIRLIEDGFTMIHEQKNRIIASDLNTVDKLKQEMIALPDQFAMINWFRLNELQEKYPRAAARLQDELNRNWEGDFALMDEGIAKGELRPFNKSLFKLMFTATVESFLRSEQIAEGIISYQDALGQMTDILIDGIRA